jgi:acetoacetyl-CoA synthetase
MEFLTKFQRAMQSAKYLDVLSKSFSPKSKFKLAKLRQLLSTGSPLKAELFDWCYENVKSDFILGSITGGPLYSCEDLR